MVGFCILYSTQKCPALFTPYPRQAAIFPFLYGKKLHNKGTQQINTIKIIPGLEVLCGHSNFFDSGRFSKLYLSPDFCQTSAFKIKLNRIHDTPFRSRAGLKSNARVIRKPRILCRD